MNPKVTELDKCIARRLRQTRLETGMTQARVARHLGCSYQSYQRLEAGKISFRAAVLVNLAQLFSADIRHFLGEDPFYLVSDTRTPDVVFHFNRVDPETQDRVIQILTRANSHER